MGIAGFPSLVIPLKLAEPEYLERVSSVFLFCLRCCWRNWPLPIGSLQLFKSSFHWSSKNIQTFSPVDQVKEIILASGSVPEQGIIDTWSSLYNLPHCGTSTLTLVPFIASDHFINTMIDIASSWAQSYMRIDSSLYSSEKKPWSDWLPFGDNHSSKSWSSCPWSRNSPSVKFGGLTIT